MNAITDYDVMTAMAMHGGSFTSRLAQAALCADAENLSKIKAAFPEIWQNYLDVATLHKQRRALLPNLPEVRA